MVTTVNSQPTAEQRDVVQRRVESLVVVGRRSRLTGIATPLPMQVVTRSRLSSIQLQSHFDFVLLESEHTSAILDNPSLSAHRVILRLHNDEAQYFRSLAASERHMLRKAYYAIESIRFAQLARSLHRQCDELWFISRQEHQRFVERNPVLQNRARVLPPPVSLSSLKTRRYESAAVLFLGTLSLPNNIEGLRWYINKIHPLLRGIPDYRLMIAGNTREHESSWIRSVRDMDSTIQLIENPVDLESLYSRACVFVNPMLNGAGVKLKTINAIQEGLPVVTTSVGCEGTGLVSGDHLLVADEPAEFAACVARLVKGDILAQQLVQNAQAFLRLEYNHKKLIAQFLSRLFGAASTEPSSWAPESR